MKSGSIRWSPVVAITYLLTDASTPEPLRPGGANEIDSGSERSRIKIGTTLADLRSLIDDWSGLAVLLSYHSLTDSWIFIALHDTTLGPAVGGCRITTYATPADGLRDAMRLAEGMTHKWAILGADSGGGKAVVALRQELTDNGNPISSSRKHHCSRSKLTT